MHCRRFIAPPISRRDMLARCANGFGAVALAALLGEEGYGSGMAEIPEDLSKWLVTAPPAKCDSRYYDAYFDSKHTWVVFNRDGRPSARLRVVKREGGSPYPEWQESYPPMPFKVEQGSFEDGLAGEWFSTKVTDGWIIGFNKGEWGGGLWWFSPDGKKRSKISKDQVVGFLETDAGLLALEGCSHGFADEGKIIRLSRGGDGFWHSELFVDLKGAPETAVKDRDGTLMVATHDRLLRIHPGTRELEVLLADAFWGGLGPNSVIHPPSGSIFVGMRHGVVEVEKIGAVYNPKWLIPNAEYGRAAEKHPEGFR